MTRINEPVAWLIICACAATAHAQLDSTATWLWEVTTDNGDAVVEPGETAAVTLSVLMELPPDAPKDLLVAFGAAMFDTLGANGAPLGHIKDWTIHNQLDFAGDQTTTDGVSLFNTYVGQPIQDIVLDNPIDVLTFYWAADASGRFDVAYSTKTSIPDQAGFVHVLVGPPDCVCELQAWLIEEASVAFLVVPPPATMTVVLFGASHLWLRRRESDRT